MGRKVNFYPGCSQCDFSAFEWSWKFDIIVFHSHPEIAPWLYPVCYACPIGVLPSIVKLTINSKNIIHPGLSIVTIVLYIKFCHIVVTFRKSRRSNLKRKNKSDKIIIQSKSKGACIFKKYKMPQSGVPLIESGSIIIDPNKVFQS